MSGENKHNPPLLRTDELQRLEQLRAEGIDPLKIHEAVELEADVLLLKFMREELESMMDEIREYMSPDLAFGDCMNQLQEDWVLVAETVIQNMYKKNRAVYGKNSKMSMGKVDEMAEARTEGESVLIMILIKKSLNMFNAMERLLAEGGQEKVNVFIQTVAKKIREVLKNLKTIKGCVNSAKVAKTVVGLYTQQEIAAISGLGEDEIGEIMDVRAKILDKLFKRKPAKQSKSPRELHQELGNLVNTDALTAYVNYHQELKHLRLLMASGKIVETDYVKRVIEEAMVSLTKNPPTTVYLHGDYGTGKTAIATHIARTRFHKEPIIVAGNKFLEPERFTEEMKIEKMEPVDFVNEQLKRFGSEKRFKKGEQTGDMIGALVGEKAQIVDQIIATRKNEQGLSDLPPDQVEEIKKMVDAVFENQVQGRYVIGAMYEAMKEGRPLIIDEANAITPEVMIAFNDLMTKKIGDKFFVRTDEKEIEVQEGYCVIWTGNTGGRYKNARYNDVDPAAFSRLHPIKVEYLPQTVYTSNVSGVFEERLELDKLSERFMDEAGNIEGLQLGTFHRQKETAKTDQIFQVLLVKLLNRRMGARLLVKKDDPYSVFKDLYRLSAAARLIMNVFEENVDPGDFPMTNELKRWTGAETVTDVIPKLRKSNLTMRGLLDKIVASYLNDHMSMDIEYYVFKFVKELDILPEEMAIIYSILNKYFFLGSGWGEINSARNLSEFEQKISNFDILSLPKYEKVDINGDYVSLLKPAGEEGEYELRYFSSLETMQLMFGYLPPRKVSEYIELADNVDKVQTEKNKLKGVAEKEREVRDNFEFIREAFDPEKFFAGIEMDQPAGSGSELEAIEKMLEITARITAFNAEIIKLRINDSSYMSSLSHVDYLETAGKFCDMILKVLVEARLITEQEEKVAQDSSVEERLSMTAALVDRISKVA
jgi:MoxR-like ATPase